VRRTSGLRSVNPIAIARSELPAGFIAFLVRYLPAKVSRFDFISAGREIVCSAFDAFTAHARASRPACARDFYSIAAGPRIYIFFLSTSGRRLREPSSSTGITACYTAWEKNILFIRLFSAASAWKILKVTNAAMQKEEIISIFLENCFRSS